QMGVPGVIVRNGKESRILSRRFDSESWTTFFPPDGAIMQLRAACFPLAVALVLATGCDHRLPLAPQAAQGLNAGPVAADGVSWSGGAGNVEGTTGPGALYAIDVPENWNGELVVYAHGYVEESGVQVALPNIGYFRDPLLARGFAVAYSSFS